MPVETVSIFMVVGWQELQEMLERHRLQNEAWLRARAEENDKERKELCKLRVCDHKQLLTAHQSPSNIYIYEWLGSNKK